MEIKKSSFLLPNTKKEYINLYSANNNLSVFQNYLITKQYFSLPQKIVHFFNNLISKRKSNIKLFTLYDNKKPIFIVPVSLEEKNVRLLGSSEGLEFTEIVHSISNASDYSYYLNCMLSYFKNNGYNFFIWDFVPNYSLANNYLKEHSIKTDMINYVRLRIPAANKYDDYYHSLSKHARQNLRTAYNRAQKQSLSINFRFFQASDKNFKSAYNESRKIYLNRQKLKYGDNLIGSIQKKYFHYLSNLPSCDFGAIACLYFNEKMVACMQGYYEKNDNSFSVPRLAINMDYSFFSPGILLINESIKYFSNYTELKFIDLTRGDEQYKFDMGGEKYKVNNYLIDLNQIDEISF